MKSKVKKVSDAKLWKVFSEYIRLRDANEQGYCKCFTCGLIRHWKQVDCGHGIGRQHWATRYSEKNNHAQCKKCNGFEGGRMDVYKERVNETYGPNTWELMEVSMRKPGKKPSQFEIDVLTIHYRKEVEKLKSVKQAA